MKTFTKILFSLTLAGLLAAGLTGCASATDPVTDTGPKARPFTTASSDIGVGLTFEDGKGILVSNYSSAAFPVVEDKGTNGTYVLSVKSTGNYEHAVYTFASAVNFTTPKTLKIDLKTPATDGTVLVLSDGTNQYFYWVPGTGAWATTTLTISGTGITDGTNAGWQGDAAKPIDMTKVTSFEISGNEHVETILADNISLK